MRFKKVDGWMELHEMALLHIALAHGTDHDLTDAEVRDAIQRLRTWSPKHPRDVAAKTFHAVLLSYIAAERDQLIEMAAEGLKQSLDAGLRLRMLNDLAEVAHADGKVVPLEASFIQMLARYWDFPAPDVGPVASA